MTRLTTSAIVLDSEAWGESDCLVRLLTPEQGRMITFAKGALRSRKRFAGMFELGQVIEAGTHEELLQRGAAYARLYQTQFVSEPDGKPDHAG